MLISKTVLVKGNIRNIKFYKDKNYDIKVGSEIEILVSDLSHGSTYKIDCKCSECGKIYSVIYANYLIQTKNSLYFCKDCKSIKTSETNIIRYGFKSPMQNPEILEKTQITNIERYGNKCSLRNSEVDKKTVETNRNNLGHDRPFSSNFVLEKGKATLKEKKGCEYPLQCPEYLENMKQTVFSKFGYNNYSKTDIFKDSMSNIKLILENNNDYDYDYRFVKYNSDNTISIEHISNDIHIFNTDRATFNNRHASNNPFCTICYPIADTKSIKEKLFKKLISVDYINNDRTVLEGKELDVYIPSLNLAFEYNGLYHHSDKFKSETYHRDKFFKSLEKGVDLINIWEDDNLETVKHLINNMLYDYLDINNYWLSDTTGYISVYSFDAVVLGTINYTIIADEIVISEFQIFGNCDSFQPIINYLKKFNKNVVYYSEYGRLESIPRKYLLEADKLNLNIDTFFYLDKNNKKRSESFVKYKVNTCGKVKYKFQ